MYVAQGVIHTLMNIGECMGHLQKDNYILTLKMWEFLSSISVSLVSLAECNLKSNTDQFLDLPVRDTKLLILLQKKHILANSSYYSLI